MGSRVELTRAVLAGKTAARTQQPPTTCPHPPRTLLRTAWFRGYGQGAAPAE
ncbi:Rmf/CrpP fold protein [Streptomyces sp. RKAG293]|uniref:Rmf/CrpP fold protein n=1 Tax=Streptomyces sp. RKAG293 TaxID=2893403 RepID=UPI0027E3F0C7|nr:Rmf/CrpP fold protein [Streptomyces sp. RKAG293]